MPMNTFSCLRATILMMSLCASVFGQEIPAGTRVVVRPELTASADEQIAHCARKIRSLRSIQDERERLNSMLQVMSSLSLLQQRWPEAREAVLQSYLMQADLALEWSMPRNVIDILNAALPESRRTLYEIRFNERLARAYRQMGDLAAAERHLLVAERSPMFPKANRVISMTVLQELAMLYSRQERPRESLLRWRAAANLAGQAPNTRVGYLLAALKEAVRLSDDAHRAEAHAIAREVDEAIMVARSSGKPDPRALAAYESDLSRLKKQLR